MAFIYQGVTVGKVNFQLAHLTTAYVSKADSCCAPLEKYETLYYVLGRYSETSLRF